MPLEEYANIFEALDNQRRREIYEYVLTNYFVPKNELSLKFDLKRASLNHHLEIMKNAGLIFELPLSINGIKQTFITHSALIHTDKLLEPVQNQKKLAKFLQGWRKRNLTLETWQTFRDSLHNLNILENIFQAIEERISPSLGSVGSAEKEICFICHTNIAKMPCFTCKNLICTIHAHEIDRAELGTVTLCPNCVKKFFG